jgi:DNA topoisomerase-6 subunit B
MATRQREISVSEFFTKNRHLLGFDSPRKALLTAVKEAVDNSLDACEEAGILPEVWVEITRIGTGDDQFTHGRRGQRPGHRLRAGGQRVRKLLYGSKFHKLRQSRGQQGIGISAAGMYGQLTTGKPVRDALASPARRPRPRIRDVASTRPTTGPTSHEKNDRVGAQGARHAVSIEMEASTEGPEERRGVPEADGGRQPARARCTTRTPGRQRQRVPARQLEGAAEGGRGDQAAPARRRARHPAEDAQESENAHLSAFLQEDFSRVGPKVAKEICEKAGIKPGDQPAAHRPRGRRRS